MKNTGHTTHKNNHAVYECKLPRFRHTEARRTGKRQMYHHYNVSSGCDHSLVNRFQTGKRATLIWCLVSVETNETEQTLSYKTETRDLNNLSSLYPSGTTKLWGSPKTPDNDRDNPSSKQTRCLLTSTDLTWGGKYRLHIYRPSKCCTVLSDMFLWNILIYGPIRQLPCQDV